MSEELIVLIGWSLVAGIICATIDLMTPVLVRIATGEEAQK